MKRCPTCGKEFDPRKRGIKQVYCSRKCLYPVARARAKARYEEGIKAGFLYGRPITDLFFDRYRTGAAKRGIPWEMSKEEFLSFWRSPCSYCGAPIETIGLDRMDNDLGYVGNNVTPCCTTCNLSKRGMSAADYVAHCQAVARKSSQE